MKNKPLHTSGASEEPPKETDGEENDDGGRTRGTNLNLSSERCPICLNYLSQDLGFPENCYHAFCVNCILKWSETSTSCPVDRKPFQIVYKINPATGCTKVHVKTKRPREQCCCNGNPLYSLCCAKTTIRYRTDSNKELSSHNILNNKSDRCISREEVQTSESELNNLTRHDPCYTSDFVSVCQQNGPLGFPLVGPQDFSEFVELDLIQQKREGLKYLRPTGVAKRSGLIMSHSGETEARLTSMPALSLDDYIPPLCNFSIRNKGFSTRTCVNSSAQEGTEKKAASGASNGRGSRRKTSQSTTRRRSTRNSKSKDVGQLPSSPKSNNSDRESPDCNNSSANVSSASQALKTPPKQRKRAPKKRAQTRKRLRSGTRTKEESSGSKENSADESEEQPEKKPKILNEDAFETADSDIDSSAAHNIEAVQERVDCRPSPPSSPIQLQSDENGPVSPPASTEQCSDEKTFDSSSQNEQETDLEDEPPSRNNHDLMEKKSPTPPTSNQDNSECEQSAPSPLVEKSPFNSDEECSDFKKPQSSEGENCSISSAAEGDVSDHTKSPLFQTARRKGESDDEDSEASEKRRQSDVEDNEKTLDKDSHESNISDCSSSSDENDSPSKSDRPVEYTQNRSVSTESDELSDSRNGPLSPEPPLLENALNASMDEKSLDSDQENPPELDNSPDFKVGENERNSAIAESASHEVPVSGKHSVDDAVGSPTGKYSTDDEADRSSGSVEGKETTSEPDECPDRSPEIQTGTAALQHAGPRASSSDSDDSAHDSNHNETEGSPVPVDVTKNVSLQPSHEPSDLNKDVGPVSDQQKELCEEDNNESVAMECESLDSDHNESEIEQQTAKIKPPEPVAEIKEEVKAQSAETVHATEKTTEAPKKEARPRRSRFHSPSTTWSPQKTDAKTDVKERQRSRSRGRDSPEKRRSRSRSRDRDGSRDRGGQWKGRSRERWHRRHSKSKSRSRSRSRSPSRPAARNKGPPPDRNEMDCGSPPWREKRQYDNWRSPRGNERYRRHEPDKPSENFRREKHDINRDSTETYKDSSNQDNYPDWVQEKIKSDEARGKGSNRSRGSPRGSHWDSNHYSQGDAWNKSPNMDWKSPRGRGGRGRGRGGFRGSFGYGDQNENRWNDRPPFSGNSNSSGHESSRFTEQRNYRPKYEQEPFDPPPDRSGWSSASSWAVRKTLPADVQNYYSKRGRGPVGSQPAWPRQEESQDQALKVDQPIQDQASQPAEAPPMPVNMMPPQINVVQPQINNPPPPQPMNMFPYAVSVPPPQMVNIQHNPYSIHQQLPMHIHPGLPMQVPVQVSAPASVSQGLPPPPPPPPPSQQVNYVPSQQEAKPMQSNPPVASHVGNNFSAPILPAPTPTMGIVGTVLGPNAGIVASSTHSKTSHSSVKPPARKEVITVEATADSSKKEKKLQIQERAAHEVKMAIKQYYQNKDITKDEYKEIVKKAVDKVCHSKSGEVDSAKVANLIKAYVDKYKHSRKKD